MSVHQKRFESFDKFMDSIESISECYNCINPTDARNSRFKNENSYEMNDIGMELLRGGIVRLVALWEGYVKDVMREAFESVILNSMQTPTKLKKIWPECEIAFQNELKKEANKAVKPSNEGGKPNGKKRKEEILTIASRAFLMESPWRSLIEDHLDTALNKLKVPLFDNSKYVEESRKYEFDGEGIDATFAELVLGEEFCISQKMIELGVSFTLRTGPKDTDQIGITLRDRNQLWNLSRLFYGVRCIFAHGDPTRTLDKALKNFPTDARELLGEEYELAGHYLVTLYEFLIKYKSETNVSYLNWVNILRFYKAAAVGLREALALWKSKKSIPLEN